MNERLEKLREIGQSVWVDSLSRDDIQNGNLQRMREDGVLGVTSNPPGHRAACHVAAPGGVRTP